MSNAVMTNAEARKIFDDAIDSQADPDKKADLAICREFFTNPEFRKWLEETVYELTA